MNRRGLRPILFIALVLWTGLCAAAIASPSTRRFDLPSASAETTLRRFARQADVQLIFDPDIVAGVRTRALIGHYDPAEALAAILAGTPLQMVRDPVTGAFAVGKKIPLPVTEVEPRPVLPGAPNVSSAPHPPDHPMGNTTSSSLPRPRFLSRLATGLAALFAVSGLAQSTPPAPDDEAIVLSVFNVSSELNADRYLPTEALAGGRARVNLFDSSQNISVIPQEVLADVGTTRVLDAAKYVAGLSESIIPNGLDFITFRGFLTRGQMIDGFSTGGDAQINLDPIQIERLEIIKGPNAILAPIGSPGGAINITSKKPLYRDQGRLSVEVGQIDSDRVELDVNRVLGTEKKNLAVRVLAAAQDGSDYADGTWKRNWTVIPMLGWRISPTTQLYVQGNFSDSKIQNYNGLPIDPSSGTSTGTRLLAGVAHDANIYDLPGQTRWQEIADFRFGLTSRLTDHLSARLGARHITYDNGNQDLPPSGPTGGAVDPRTGFYTPGFVYGPGPSFTAAPASQPRIMPRGGRQNPFQSTFWNIQNDYAYELKTRHVNSTTLAGVAVNHFDNASQSIVVTGGAVDFDNLAAYPRTVMVGAVSNNQYTERDDRQLYLSETIGLLDDRLILNASNSWSAYDYSVLNRVTGVKQDYDPTTRQFAYGVVAKPLPNVALFYSSSEQKSPQNPFSIAVGQKPIQTGRQSEFGVRVGLMDKKLIVTLSHFDIEQDNFAITNPGNLAVPSPVPLLPPLIADLTSKGWEFEFSGYLTPQLTVLGNYTDYRMRDAYGVRQRAVPDRSAGIWLHYEFADVSALHGLSLGLGANHLGERAGDQVSGLAAGSTPAAPIPNQPTFYLPGRTLVDASVGYKFSRHWHAQLNVANLLDTEYIAASASRYIVFPGATINARLRVTYTF